MTPATSDLKPRNNEMTDLEWLRLILSGREVTRITQHLALVIWAIADIRGGASRSVRDLEAITGWSRETISDHLAELEIFIKVTLGRGRAKTQFGLEAAITHVLKRSESGGFVPYVVASQPDATHGEKDRAAILVAKEADAKIDAKPDTTFVANQADALPDARTDATLLAEEDDGKTDAKPDTNFVASQPDAKSLVVASQPDAKPNEGGTIGGESRTTVQNLSLSHLSSPEARERVAITIGLQPDGSFEGHVFGLTAIEVEQTARNYPLLSFPADLVAADLFFKLEFAKHPNRDYPDEQARTMRLAQYLASQNRKMQNNTRLLEQTARRKPEPRQPAAKREDVCWFDDHAKLQVANGFKAELLDMVGGDEMSLREELDCAAGFVGTGVNSFELTRKVRSRIRLQTKEKRDKDERYAKAVSRNNSDSTDGASRAESAADIALRAVRARAQAEKKGPNQ